MVLAGQFAGLTGLIWNSQRSIHSAFQVLELKLCAITLKPVDFLKTIFLYIYKCKCVCVCVCPQRLERGRRIPCRSRQLWAAWCVLAVSSDPLQEQWVGGNCGSSAPAPFSVFLFISGPADLCIPLSGALLISPASNLVPQSLICLWYACSILR